MFIKIYDSTKKCLIQPSDIKYPVIETHDYTFQADNTYNFDHVILEGVKDRHTGEDKKIYFDTKPEKYFLNCLGIFTLFDPDGQKVVELNIFTKKMNDPETKEIFEYVFSKNYEIFDSFLNRQRFYTAEENKKQNIELSLFKYLGVVNEFLECLKYNFHQFSNRPAYKLKTKLKKVDYKENLITPKSIEWLVSNLDEFRYDLNFKIHPEAIRVWNTYALPHKIITEEKFKNINIYENKIIKGAINKLGKSIQQISKNISNYLSEDETFDLREDEFASFESLKRVILKSELQRLEILKANYKSAKTDYSKIFKNVMPLENFPKLTHTFKTKRHYRDAYHKIAALYKSSINYPGAYLILGIKNLDVLYEYYNFYIILDLFKEKYGTPELYFNDNTILYAYFYSKNCVFRIYYQLKINRRNAKPRYPWIRLFANTNISIRLSPDIVIEREENSQFNYAIFDAKYSSRSWVTGKTFFTLVGKYFFSLAMQGEPYKKIDFLYLLYPYQGPSDIFSNEKGYYPEMGVIPSSPNNLRPLANTIYHILERWDQISPAIEPIIENDLF